MLARLLRASKALLWGLFWLAFVTGPMVVCGGTQLELLREVKTLRAHETWKPASSGPVLARGSVRSRGLVRSPLGRECAAWRGEITRRVTSRNSKGKEEVSRVTDCTAKASAPLSLAVEGAELELIDLELATGDPRASEVPLADVREPPCVAKRGADAPRYTETCLLPDDEALATGCVRGGRLGPCGDGFDELQAPPRDDRVARRQVKLAWLAGCGAVFVGLLGAAGGLRLLDSALDARRRRR